MWSQSYLQRTLEVVGPERILFSTDYPYQYRPGKPGRFFLEEAALSPEQKELFARGNWERPDEISTPKLKPLNFKKTVLNANAQLGSSEGATSKCSDEPRYFMESPMPTVPHTRHQREGDGPLRRVVARWQAGIGCPIVNYDATGKTLSNVSKFTLNLCGP